MTDDRQLTLDLPKLDSVFEALRRGKHVCMTDGALYAALKSHTEDFTALFTRLGFELVHHPRDFFYFVDRGNFTDTSARMAVFMFILIEALADRGDAVEESIMSQHFRYADLPHLTGDRYRQLMREADIAEPGQIEQLLQSMERFGFVERLPDDSFTFRPPSYRFLDLCLDFAPSAADVDTDPGDEPSDDGSPMADEA